MQTAQRGGGADDQRRTPTRRDVAAVVVLYHPHETVAANIAAIASQVDRVFAVDNTEPAEGSTACMPAAARGTEYVSLGGNLGIAAALNAGADLAREAGYSWIITMDQDSTAEPGMVDSLVDCMASLPATPPIGIITPQHHQVGAPPPVATTGCTDVLTAMTSGNLLSLDAFGAVGPFMTELFIDRVDAEYCLRLHRHGYRVISASGAVLHHRVGATERRRFPWPAYPSNHSPLRHYYMARNRFVVARMYRDDFPDYGSFEMRRLVVDAAKVVLYESSKVRKLGMMWRGFRDYRAGRLGRFEERA